ncbi:MAG: hypothetical protein ACE5HH_01480, partial [Candidatus Hydrothermarchaeales archaeon]
DFEQYKTQKFIVILGGPDAPEGVGDLINNEQFNLKLKADEIEFIRQAGNKRKIYRSNVWATGQSVWILAGANRELTKAAHQEHRSSVAQEVESATQPTETVETPTDPCPPNSNNPLNHTLGFESVDARGDVYICEVVYAMGKGNWKITLYNQGEEGVDIHRYRLIDRNNRFYRIMGDTGEEILVAGGYWIIYGTTFNPQGKSTSGVYLPPQTGDLSLQDSAETLLDKVEWGS